MSWFHPQQPLSGPIPGIRRHRPHTVGRGGIALWLLVAMIGFPWAAPVAAQDTVTPPADPVLLAVAEVTLSARPNVPPAGDFGFASVRGAPKTLDYTVTNLGGAPLSVTDITSDSADFTVSASTLGPIAPETATTFTVTFDPQPVDDGNGNLVRTGPRSGTLHLLSNSAFNPDIVVGLVGESVDVAITITANNTLLVPLQSAQLSVVVTGSTNRGVIWQIISGGGSVSASGRFTASTSGATVVRAVSVADPLTHQEISLDVHPADSTADGGADATGAFATAIAVADVDGDGLLEVFSGAPGADVAGTPAAGSVWVRRFGTAGFDLNTPPVIVAAPTPVTNGAFGTTVVVADLNGDGNPDLAVGEPGLAAAEPHGGRLHVYLGGGDGTFVHLQTMSLATGLPGDRFGHALAVGTYAGTPDPIIAVGAPGRAQDGVSGVGEVHFYRLGVAPGGGALVETASTPITIPLPAVGDPLRPNALALARDGQFGHAIATACIDQCTRFTRLLAGLTRLPDELDPTLLPAEIIQFDDLVVGMPGAVPDPITGNPTRAGSVFLFLADTTTGGLFAPGRLVPSPAPVPGDRFGYALVAGDLNISGLDDLVVGAPGQPVTVNGTVLTGGMVFTYLSNGFGGVQPVDHMRDPAAVHNGEFGATLVAVPFDNNATTDLLVGAPGHPNGEAYAFLSAADGTFFTARGFAPTTLAPGDRFGTALAVGDLNRDTFPDLLTGAPANGGGGLHLHLDLPPAPVRIDPHRAVVTRAGAVARSKRFLGDGGATGAAGLVWNVLDDNGVISTGGVLSPVVGTQGRFSHEVDVRVSLVAGARHWGLARTRVMERVGWITAPKVDLSTTGAIELGLPENGLNFGRTLAVTHVGRVAGAPFPDLPSVIGGFRAINSNTLPRIHIYPFDDDLNVPFGGVNFVFGSRAERTGWGAEVVVGDFNNDGVDDLAVSAPFGSTDEADRRTSSTAISQVGFLDLIYLDSNGNLLPDINGVPTEFGLRLQSDPFPVDLSPGLGTAVWADRQQRANSRWGGALLAHDLNGDGVTDLVVGSPHAMVGGVRGAGMVDVLLLGPINPLTTQPILRRVTLTEQVPRRGAFFGAALAAGDTDGNGVPELYVGAPGIDPVGSGTLLSNDPLVVPFAPTSWAADNTLRDRLQAGTAPAAGAPPILTEPVALLARTRSEFGARLLMADFIPDDPAPELIVGAPAAAVVSRVSLDPLGARVIADSGLVLVYDADPITGTLAAPIPIAPDSRQGGMRFGEGLALGYLRGTNALPTLVVGAPRFGGDAGANEGQIYLYAATTSPLPVLEDRMLAPRAHGSNTFGAAILTADLDLDPAGREELIVGSPGADLDILLGLRVTPGRFGGVNQVIARRAQAGQVYVIFPTLN